MKAALGVILLFAALAGAGCARSGGEAETRIRISQRNEPVDLDPATASLPDEFFIIRALSEGLLTPNPAGGPPLPAAAEGYEVSSDGLTYTFHLRHGALWSNGEPVTAADFIASWRRVLTPSTAAPKAQLFYAVKNAQAFARGALSDFEQVGFRSDRPDVISITLAQPTPNFPFYVASGPWIPVNPRMVARYGRRWTEPANYTGNGPFVLRTWRAQQRIVVRKNDRYRAAPTLHVGELQFIRFDNQDTEERAYRAGQIDVTMAVPQTKLDFYQRQRPGELHHTPLAETRFIAFNLHRAPLTDFRVRRALSLAINREKIVGDVLHGGQRAATRFLSPALLGYASGALPAPEPLTFDPAAARRLLAEAGYPNGSGFPRLELAGWDRNPTLDAIQEMWRQELGINARIVIQEAKVHLAALAAGTYDIAFVTNLLDVPDPVAALADFTTDAPNNFPHWRSPEFDLAVQRAARTRGSEAAVALGHAESLLLESAAVVPVYFNAQNWLMSPHVEGWEQDSLWTRRYDDLRVR